MNRNSNHFSEVEESNEAGYLKSTNVNGVPNNVEQSPNNDNFDLQGSASSDATHSDMDDDLDDFDLAPGKDDMSLMSSDDDISVEHGYDNDTAQAISTDLLERKARSASNDSTSNNKRKLEKIAKLSDSAKMMAKEKNREHAKNTRIRKKNYIESLKETVKQLSDEREKAERERNIAVNKLLEQAKTRKKVLHDLFQYRSKHVLDRKLWSTILEDNAVIVLPVTPYRSFPAAQVCQGQRYIHGIDAMIADVTSHAVLFQSIAPDHHLIDIEFTYANQDCTIIEDTLMCRWELSSRNAVKHGCKLEISLRGMLKAIFSPHNRLVCVEMIYDVMSYMQQLRRAAGKRDFAIIPNTLPLAEESNTTLHKEVRVIFQPSAPHIIHSLNEEFTRLYGYNPEELLTQKKTFFDLLRGTLVSSNGKGMKLPSNHGKHDNKSVIEDISNYMKNGWCYSTILSIPVNPIVNAFSDGTDSEKNVIITWLRIFPLYAEQTICQYLAILEPHIVTSSHGQHHQHSHAHFLTASTGSSSSGSSRDPGSQSSGSSGYTTHAATTPTTSTSSSQHSHPHQHPYAAAGAATSLSHHNVGMTNHSDMNSMQTSSSRSTGTSSSSGTNSSSGSSAASSTSSASSFASGSLGMNQSQSSSSANGNVISGGGGGGLSSISKAFRAQQAKKGLIMHATSLSMNEGSDMVIDPPLPPPHLTMPAYTPPNYQLSMYPQHLPPHYEQQQQVQYSPMIRQQSPSNLTNRLFKQSSPPAIAQAQQHPAAIPYLHPTAPSNSPSSAQRISSSSQSDRMITDSPPDSTTSSNKSAEMLQEILQIVGEGSSGSSSVNLSGSSSQKADESGTDSAGQSGSSSGGESSGNDD